MKSKYAINKALPRDLEPNGEYPNCIWTLWLQGEQNAPQIVKNCLKNLRKHSNGQKVIVLDEKSIEKYLILPTYVMEKYKNKKMKAALFSDIVRYALLYKYGGVWIDSTALITGKIPDEILNQDFFMFQVRKFKRQNNLFLTANWFIHAKPGNVILKDLINLSFEYWKQENELVNYNLSILFFTMSVNLNSESKKIFDRMLYVPEQLHFYIYLTKNYRKNLFEALKKYSIFPIHKLAYRERLYEDKPWEYWDENSSLFHYLDRENAILD